MSCAKLTRQVRRPLVGSQGIRHQPALRGELGSDSQLVLLTSIIDKQYRCLLLLQEEWLTRIPSRCSQNFPQAVATKQTPENDKHFLHNHDFVPMANGVGLPRRVPGGRWVDNCDHGLLRWSPSVKNQSRGAGSAQYNWNFRLKQLLNPIE